MGNFTTKEAGPSEGPESLLKYATAEDKAAIANKLGNDTTRACLKVSYRLYRQATDILLD